MAAEEARIEQTEVGAVVASPGWFVLNMADVAWMRDASGRGGEWSNPEPPEGEFEQYGIGIHVLNPGQMNGLYHSESVQEDFLVLSGECLLLIEEEERPLKAWDFVHCSPGAHHIFAARHGASASEETDTGREAYRDWPRDFEQVRARWPL